MGDNATSDIQAATKVVAPTVFTAGIQSVNPQQKNFNLGYNKIPGVENTSNE